MGGDHPPGGCPESAQLRVSRRHSPRDLDFFRNLPPGTASYGSVWPHRASSAARECFPSWEGSPSSSSAGCRSPPASSAGVRSTRCCASAPGAAEPAPARARARLPRAGRLGAGRLGECADGGGDPQATQALRVPQLRFLRGRAGDQPAPPLPVSPLAARPAADRRHPDRRRPLLLRRLLPRPRLAPGPARAAEPGAAGAPPGGARHRRRARSRHRPPEGRRPGPAADREPLRRPRRLRRTGQISAFVTSG